MAVDHARPLPVDPERLAAVSKMLYPHAVWPQPTIAPAVYAVALLGELVEEQARTSFFLGEAYDIYNARFR